MASRIKQRIRIIRQGNRSRYVKLDHLGLSYLKSPSTLWLFIGFAAAIFIGWLLLLLPISSQGPGVSGLDALFTATSAVCVTGLTVFDTAGRWTLFGQSVILILIQIGGFGIMAGGTLLLIGFGHKVGLRERLLIGRSIGAGKLGGTVRLIRQMALFVLVAEVLGAAIFFFKFSSLYTPGEAAWKSIFHSVSAFNNAGFDLFGSSMSLSAFRNDDLTLVVTAVLILLGGISYVVLLDVFNNRGRMWKLGLDSKLVLIMTVGLLLAGMFIMWGAISSSGSTAISELSPVTQGMNAFFQSVTARTAGFSSLDMASLPQWSLLFMMILMFIGGAAGSAAGGIKVNTFGIVIASVWSIVTGKRHTTFSGREIGGLQFRKAITIIFFSLFFILLVIFILAITEKMDFMRIAFETVSAFGTVGLSTGITPFLTTAGKALIILTMFIGRLAPLFLALMLVQDSAVKNYRYPEEEIRLG